MNSKIIVVSELNRELLPENEEWLVIGPLCWGRSRSLPVALEKAAASLSYGGGQFNACVIPKGDLVIDDMGSYRVEGWTEDQRNRAKESTRMVAVTKTAVQRWTGYANDALKGHQKILRKK
jgi:hypothetical protein